MGRRVRVLERSARFGEVGAGLQLAPNATRVLRRWGLLDQVVAAGVARACWWLCGLSGRCSVERVHQPFGAGAGGRDVLRGSGRHFVRYALRGGDLVNQVAVFHSPQALAGERDWGDPDELDAAFAGTCDPVREALPSLRRDRCWRMYDREPIDTWVDRRLALTGDAAHPMPQYLAQGACQALEDADHLAEAVAAHSRGPGGSDWDAALRDYAATRTVRTARVQRTARSWGELWHCYRLFRAVRNAMLADRDPADYRHVDWLYGG